MCVQSGKWVWCLNIDVTVLDDSGNVLDAALLAVISALRHFRLPEVSYLDDDTFVVSNIEIPKVPPSLVDSFDEDRKYNIYINGVNIPSAKWTSEVSGSNLLVNFNTGSLSEGGVYPTDLVTTTTELGYNITGSDEFGITGKFIELWLKI